ncbi:MAG: MiaB/RimO family radical SAM methylthiotransferase, partial [Alistipes sp.]|nr:MiaB/RimO family radical SAM methylthiotransferase [Alistipes sp.]
CYEDMGIITSMESRTRAFIKVQEGCNRFCSYCVIPYARGMVRSRPKEDVLKEAQALIDSGFKELVLAGINTALYGAEPEFPKEESGLTGVEILIDAISKLDGDFRIRLSSLEPTVVNGDYVKRLLKYDKLCHHLHLSAQSGSDNVLSAMNRRYDRREYLEIAAVLKEADPGYGISTDLIAGFPGETEADHQDSLRLIREAGFYKVHAFTYSKRPGTKAAEMKGHLAPQLKKRCYCNHRHCRPYGWLCRKTCGYCVDCCCNAYTYGGSDEKLRNGSWANSESRIGLCNRNAL